MPSRPRSPPTGEPSSPFNVQWGLFRDAWFTVGQLWAVCPNEDVWAFLSVAPARDRGSSGRWAPERPHVRPFCPHSPGAFSLVFEIVGQPRRIAPQMTHDDVRSAAPECIAEYSRIDFGQHKNMGHQCVLRECGDASCLIVVTEDAPGAGPSMTSSGQPAETSIDPSRPCPAHCGLGDRRPGRVPGRAVRGAPIASVP
jgi:hypothetical protein